MVETRILMTRRSCPYCRQMIRVINKINLKLPVDKRIQIIDCWEHEEFGLNNLPIINKLESSGLKEGYPFLFIDGCVIDNATTQEQMEILLNTFLNDDFIIK